MTNDKIFLLNLESYFFLRLAYIQYLGLIQFSSDLDLSLLQSKKQLKKNQFVSKLKALFRKWIVVNGLLQLCSSLKGMDICIFMVTSKYSEPFAICRLTTITKARIVILITIKQLKFQQNRFITHLLQMILVVCINKIIHTGNLHRYTPTIWNYFNPCFISKTMDAIL